MDATVNAVSTAVQSTLIAMTPDAPATATAQPTLGLPPSPTATLPPTPTQFVPPTNTLPAPDPTVTPGATGPERPNGALIHAARLTTAPTIDAQGGDWPSPLPVAIDQNVFKPANWSGAADQIGHFAIGWDANSLYLFVIVNDELHVQIQHGELLYQGDSLELQLDTDLAGDFDTRTLSPDDYQLGLSPGQDSASPEAYLWNPAGQRGTPTGLILASRATGDQGGYALEVAIPWSLYGLTPTGGLRLGFALNSSDDDQPGVAVQESMISTVSTRTLTDPTTWGTLQLDP
ncbi:MAG: hypothetical protein IT317_23600 [Anaerolineales bacterium]|nr:hypothetical protein [Anaerolineales bacterium]